MKEGHSVFDERFTGLYSLSKTLRFELVPQGKTLEHMHANLRYDDGLKTFLVDQEIENAYQTLKPVMDAIHERFITESLSSSEARALNILAYYAEYKSDAPKLEKHEKELREVIAGLYSVTADEWKAVNGEFKKKGYEILTEEAILKFIRKEVGNFPHIAPEEKINKSLDLFTGFFTYFSGFSTNRKNYYTTDKEAKTAVATRIVHENLPKFCDNVIAFDSYRVEYLGIFNTLKERGVALVMKNGTPLVPIVEQLFDTTSFGDCLTQNGIESYNSQIGNANFLINLHNQIGGIRLPMMKTLYKQIGCGAKSALFFELQCDTESEAKDLRESGKESHSLQEVLRNFATAGEVYFSGKSDDGIINTISEFAENILSRENYDGIYWSKQALNTISAKYLANWYELREELLKRKIFKKSTSEGEDVVIPDVVSLDGLSEVLNLREDWRAPGVFFRESLMKRIEEPSSEEDRKRNERAERCEKIIADAKTPSRALLEIIFQDMEDHAQKFLDGSSAILSLSSFHGEKEKEAIKTWMDDAVSVCHILKYFLVRESKVRAKGGHLDSVTSEALNLFLRSDDAKWFDWYDATRNYLTKKTEEDVKKGKLKLNFENSTLAAGWDVNKETDNHSVIFRNAAGKYFLGIIAKGENGKGYNKIFRKTEGNPLYGASEGEVWEKMEYKLWSDVSKMIPKCSTQLKDVIRHFKESSLDYVVPSGHKVSSGERFRDEFRISRAAFELNNRVYRKDNVSISELRFDVDESESKFVKKFQKGYFEISNDRDGFLAALWDWIDFCKYFLTRYPRATEFGYNFKDTKSYNSLDEFYGDVDAMSYQLDFVKTNEAVISHLVDEGKIYLFEIKNQDSNEGKKVGHRNNLHTMYWRALFENVANRPKLNGEAELFYRKALPVDKLKRAFNRDGEEIIKHFRFSKEKFLFHVPITLNFCKKDSWINDFVNDELIIKDEVNFIGIDRGEKHLAYYFIIDKDGKHLDDGSLNNVGGTDYNAILAQRAGARDSARKNWQTIGNIKDLKDGYVSHVVRRIVDLAIKHNAVIVLENLSVGFKRGRQKIEKSVYQKLELALAQKLNFLVDKDATEGNIGSPSRALQLTPPVQNFGDIDKRPQLGIMFYTRADYTSQTDPSTGWRKTIYLKSGAEEYIKKQILEHFTDIIFDGKDYCFSYVDKATGKEWKMYSGKNGASLDRFVRKMHGGDKGWESTRCDVVEDLGKLFKNFDHSSSLLEQMKSGRTELAKIDPKRTAWESLRFVIGLIQQIRNTGTSAEDEDFILSPVRDAHGAHFDSRHASDGLPVSGDANGAFNIARKGMIMAEHVRRGYGLYVTDDEWSAWLAGRDVWEGYCAKNAEKLKKKNKKMPIDK